MCDVTVDLLGGTAVALTGGASPMKELVVLAPFALVVVCCTLLAMEQAGQHLVFLGVSSGTWATLAGLGALASFASLFWGRSR